MSEATAPPAASGTMVSPDGASPTAAQVLWATAARSPHRNCVTDLDSTDRTGPVTYAALVERVAAIAGGLRDAGPQVGDRVALLLHNGHAYVETYLAASAAGLVVVPLNTRLVREDYLHMLADSGSRLLVTSAEFLGRVPELRAVEGLRVLDADDGAVDDLARRGTPIDEPVASDPESPASLMYTSGTTGAPKAVVLTHRSWARVSDRTDEVLAFGDDEVILHVAPLTHGAGFLLLPTLGRGGHNLLCRSYDAGRTVSLIDGHGVSGMFLVPSMVRMLLDALPEGWTPPDTLRRIYYAGSPIDAATLREGTDRFAARMIQSFAQMESPMFFTVLDAEDHRRALADPESPLVRSAGRVLPGVELRIADDDGATLPPEEDGEIFARAPQTMSGYWNRPEATAATLTEGWLHTGDIGHLTEDGHLYIVDRKKDMIVTGGSNVYAREVEDILGTLPQVADAAVIGLPDRIWGEAVTAVVVPTPEAGAEARDDSVIITACRERLAGYRVPKRVIWVDELPRNAYGKVLKRALRERFG
ncbi:class I adenylate-forming enzyme family protein [Pseudonocardia sp. KRD291]|uniref:class I adenylate-forming enzyme family protein n=1 Tax=Pseudonocardia sp. KRD291 TaxID=2792007 RepID=UPI001C49CB06|nr:AMP-binding protein [Pseudonocardia sp. KRD291]MBW0101880.1 AMP-binding protein [Pseudonocardia sp. KRD291]